MDIRVWRRAIWRFKWVSLAGLLLAVVLAVLATARISFAGGAPKLTYRTPVIYTSLTRIFVTQAGFPWGRTVLPGDGSPATGTTTYADPSRFVMLAGVYALLVNSDQIQRALVHPRDSETLTATPEFNNQAEEALPIIDINSFAPSPRRAVEMGLQATSMLRNYVTKQQEQAQIPSDQRVLLQTLQAPYRVTVATPRKKTVPIVVFMTVLLATIGLVLALENIRPRVRLGELGEFRPVRADDTTESAPSRLAG